MPKISELPAGSNADGTELIAAVQGGVTSKLTLAQAQANIVTGPASSTSGNLPTFNGTTGKVVQDSGTALSSLAPLASPTFTGTITTSGQLSVNAGAKAYDSDQTFVATATPPFLINNAYTLNFTNANFGGGGVNASGVFTVSPTLIAQQSMSNFAITGFRHAPTIKNLSSVAANLGGARGFVSRVTYTADSQTVTLGDVSDFRSRQTLNTTGGGVLNANGDIVGFEHDIIVSDSGVNISTTVAAFAALGGTVTGGTLASYTAFRASATSLGSTNSFGLDVGAITGAGTNIGVRIATAPSGGTTNIGILNAGILAQGGKVNLGGPSTTVPTYGLHMMSAVADTGAMHLNEVSGTPTNPASSAGVVIYQKADAIVFAFNDAGTMRYKSLTLSGTGVTWVHSTTAP